MITLANPATLTRRTETQVPFRYHDSMTLPPRDAQLVEIMDAAFADAARRAGPRLLCKQGCTQCCHGAFAIDALDALRLHAGMEALRTAQPELTAKLERRARAWIEAYGAGFPGDPRTGALGTSDEEQARFEDYADDAPCPALDPETGLCEIYAWRPMTCRVFGPPVRTEGPGGEQGLGHCELCFEGATQAEIAACEMQVPTALEEELLADTGSDVETVVAFALLAGARLWR